MPAHKRSQEDLYEDDVELQRNSHNIHDESEEEEEKQEVKDDEDEVVEQETDDDDDDDDDDGDALSSCSDKDDFVLVKLAEIRKEVQCPICLGIIRKTRTVMECLHRFCRECIDKSMRLGNNECPACRAHCASRRSLRDDPNYDALIAVLYPDIDKYEAEEFAFHEEEKARNKQIQASIEQTSRRQLEALGKKRTSGKATTGVVFTRRSQGNTRNLRGRRGRKSCEVQEEEEEEESENEEDAGGKDSSSSAGGDEEVRPKRYKRWGGVSSADEVETTTREILAWGRGGIRSHTRHGSLTNTAAAAAKTARNTRVSNLMDHLRKLQQTNHKLDIHLKLISLDEQNLPNMQHLDMCCSPTMRITHVIQYVALEKGLQDDEIELLLVKGDNFELLNRSVSIQVPIGEKPEPVVINPLTEELQLHQTLLDIAESSAQKDLTLVYRKKPSRS